MVVLEFRVPLPLSVDEFYRGQLYMTAQASAEATKSTEGIVWLKNEPYDNTDGSWGTSKITGTVVPKNKGQYTLKQYFFTSRVPALLAALAPANALYLIEESWNAYPHCKTVLVNGYLSKETLKIDVESMHVDGDVDLPNALRLTAAELAERKVEYLDIRSAAADASMAGGLPDPSKWKSAKTGRGPLGVGWERSPGTKPLMCCYKVVRAHLKVFGLQTSGENAITNQQRGIFTSTLCKAYVTLDEWIDVTLEEIRKLEADVAAKSNASLKAKAEGAAAGGGGGGGAA